MGQNDDDDVYLETKQARFQIQHCQIRKEKEILGKKWWYAPQDIVVDGEYVI